MKGKPRMLNLVLVFVFLFGALGVVPKPVKAQTSDLFFSEYIEGSSNNKALEIYNGTGAPVDLQDYKVVLYSNGSIDPGNTLTWDTETIIADGDVYVIANPSADPLILAESDITSNVTYYNGDDVVSLEKVSDSSFVDVIGRIGEDPGTYWGTPPYATAEQTLVRKETICEGDTDPDDVFDPADEWDAYDQNTFTYLGSHTASCSLEILPDDLFFSEYIEGSSSNKALEIYNGTGAPVDLQDYKVVLYSNGSIDPGNTLTWDTETIIPDGDVYVIANSSADPLVLAESDITSNVTYYNGDDVVSLEKVSDGSFVDVIGRIGEDPGTYWGTPPYATAEQTLVRKETICEGDTNPDDAFDPADEWDAYDQDTFDYLGAHTTNCTLPEESAPTVTSTMPADGAENVAKDANIVITFSELVTVTDPWFDIVCTKSGNHTAVVTDNNPEFVLDPDIPFQTLETCTVTIFAAGVADSDLDDPPDNMQADYSFSFDISESCGDPYIPTYEIQGSGMSTPFYGMELSTEGIVVGDFQSDGYVSGTKNGFYIQDLTGDGDPSTSDGLFVYYYGEDVQVGDHVRVVGTATEYFGLTQIGSVSDLQVCNTGMELPEPAEFSLPVTGELDFEKYEGMLVTIPQDLVISEYFNFDRYGEIMLTTQRFMTYTALNEPDAAGYAASEEEYFLNSITLDDGRTSQNPDPAIHPNGEEFTMDNLFRGGDLVTNVTGILDYYYDLYRIQPTHGADYTPVNHRPEAPDLIEGDLKVASFNVLNYFTSLDNSGDICGPSGDMGCRGADTAEELTRQRDKILAAMSEIDADIFGLMEIENDRPGPEPDYAVADLVAGLNDIAGAGTYDYIATGAVGTDAIKQAIIYKPGKVTPVGDFKALTTTVDPRFIDTKNRPTLAQVFEENLTGETFTVAVNHLKSKGSSCDDLGDPDLGDGAGNCNITRTTAAEAMVDWLADETYFPNTDNVLIIGDLNAYDKEAPIAAIKAGADDILGTEDDYQDLIHQILGEEAYGYVFDGHTGYLDYALANTNLADKILDVAIWHINADEPDLIDYDMSYKQDAQDALYAPDAYRSSDHDPVIVSLRLNEAPVAVDDYYETGVDETLVVDAPGVLANDSDPNENDDIWVELKEESGPQHGDLTLNPDGSFTYTPDPGFAGEDSFEYYMIALPQGLSRSQFVDTAKVTIKVSHKYYLLIIFAP